jgi:hypothetical protein
MTLLNALAARWKSIVPTLHAMAGVADYDLQEAQSRRLLALEERLKTLENRVGSDDRDPSARHE